MVGLRRDLLVIQQVMKKRMKPLETHLKSLGLEAGSIMLPWLQGLCVANLPNNTAFRIIDIMLAEPPAAAGGGGSVAAPSKEVGGGGGGVSSDLVLSISLAFLQMSEGQLMQCTDANQVGTNSC